MNAARRLAAMLLGAALWITISAAAAHAQSTNPADDVAAPSPLAPQRLIWPGVVVIIVIALFVAAALAGPLIRANNRDQLDDPTHPPDSDSGTINHSR